MTHVKDDGQGGFTSPTVRRWPRPLPDCTDRKRLRGVGHGEKRRHQPTEGASGFHRQRCASLLDPPREIEKTSTIGHVLTEIQRKENKNPAFNQCQGEGLVGTARRSERCNARRVRRCREQRSWGATTILLPIRSRRSQIRAEERCDNPKVEHG